MSGSVKNKIVAPELLKERQNCNFDKDELKNMFWVDKDSQVLHDKCHYDILNDPKLALTHKFYEWSPEEKQQMWMKKLRHIWDRSPESRMMYFQKGNHPQYAWNFAHHGQSMIGLHVTMFRQTVDQFSDEEQAKTWVPLTRNFDIHGCYAQTEIGHGSNVAGIETTATFDKESDCFDLHTPTKTATKWWPGDMGRFANHATVFAKVIIKDEDGNANDYGIGVFIVQLRDRKTHKHMPGVKTGDMGPKMGYEGKDNGWCAFTHVKVPRSQMLQKFTKVDRDGTFSIEGDLRIMYSTMLKTRVQIVASTWLALLCVLTISVRYSICRRQFKNISGQKTETQLLDYQTQQQKLFPIAALMFAHGFTSSHLVVKYKEMMVGVEKNDFEMLDLIHHYSAGMKAIFTQDTFDSFLIMRQSLGGAGYSAWSGIPRYIEDYSPVVTFEGDNTVMLQQSFNFLLKQMKRAQKGKDVIFPYLKEIDQTLSRQVSFQNESHFLNIDNVEEALKVQVSFGLKNLFAKMAKSEASKKDQVNSLFALDIVKVSHDHMRFMMFNLFREGYSKLKCAENRKNSELLCILFGLTQLNLDCKNCYESGYFPATNVSDHILNAIKKVNLMLRPKILNILEAWGVSDMFLQSAVGNSYGDIYEQHLEWAKSSRLNTTKNGDAIPDGYKEIMMPILKAKM